MDVSVTFFEGVRLDNLAESGWQTNSYKEGPLLEYDGVLSNDYGRYRVIVSSTVTPQKKDEDTSSCADSEDSDEESECTTMPNSAKPVAVDSMTERVCVSLVVLSKCSSLICHWGLKKGHNQWRSVLEHNKSAPPLEKVEYHMASTTAVSDLAVNSTLMPCSKNSNCYLGEFIFPASADLTLSIYDSVDLVFHDPAANVWIKTTDFKDISLKFLNTAVNTSAAAAQFFNPKKCGFTNHELALSILDCECVWNSMTLWHRYNIVMDKVRGAAAGKDDEEFWSWIFVWLRFSALSYLDWQRNYNTRPAQLAHSSQELSILLAQRWLDEVRGANPAKTAWIKMCTSCVGRGGNQGQRVRDEILEIMHRHHISERAGHFYEQWHQKLHNNTTPDDIGICRAVIAFYESNGDLNRYWEKLREHRIDRQKLASYERPITQEPYLIDCDRGHLLRDWWHYLDVLMNVHDSRDLWKSLDTTRHLLPHHIIHAIEQHQNESNLVQRLRNFMNIRRDLDGVLKSGKGGIDLRNLLLLDTALETQQNIVLQNVDRSKFSMEECVDLVQLFVEQKQRERGGEWKCLHEDFSKLAQRACASRITGERTTDSLLLKSLIDRLTRCVGDEMSMMEDLLGPKSRCLGQARKIDSSQLNVFVDEVLRGSSLFSISQLIKVAEPLIRARAKMSPWQIISPVTSLEGVWVEAVPELTHLQEKIYTKPTLLFSGRVNGEEDIPQGVVGIIVRDAASAPDVLSHVSVRARNAKVLLAVCFEPSTVEAFEKAFTGKKVNVLLTKGLTELNVTLAADQTEEEVSKETRAETAGGDLRNQKFGTGADKYCVGEDEYTRAVVGSKSYNLKDMKAKVKAGYEVPRSCAFIFGAFERCLNAKENAAVKTELESIVAKTKSTANRHVRRSFDKMRAAIMASLVMPEELKTEFAEAAAAAGLDPRKEDWESALKKVWVSLYQMRPWIALAKAGKSYEHLSMGVLVQSLVDASYAFVLHSRHPYRDESTAEKYMYGEIVLGLGEVLVGNYPGRALSWECEKASGAVTLISWPSKSVSLRSPDCLIFRSDSNGEDLEDFAGAGLFDSIPTKPCRAELNTYSEDPLIMNNEFRAQVLKRVSQAAWDIQAAQGDAHMDIEGCITASSPGQFAVHIVQCRPQV